MFSLSYWSTVFSPEEKCWKSWFWSAVEPWIPRTLCGTNYFYTRNEYKNRKNKILIMFLHSISHHSTHFVSEKKFSKLLRAYSSDSPSSTSQQNRINTIRNFSFQIAIMICCVLICLEHWLLLNHKKRSHYSYNSEKVENLICFSVNFLKVRWDHIPISVTSTNFPLWRNISLKSFWTMIYP